MNKTLLIALLGLKFGAMAMADQEVAKTTAADSAPTQRDVFLIDDISADQTAVYFDSLRAAEAKMKEAEALYAEAKAMFDGGVASKSQLAAAEAKLADAKSLFEVARKNLKTAQRLQALAQKINIDMTNAKIGSVASALSKLGNVAITVDKSVPASVTVTTKASNMPLGSVLEYVANSAKLALTLSPDGKLAFIKPSQMTVNGKAVDVMGTSWPWSQDIAVSPIDISVPIGQKWKGVFDGRAPFVVSQDWKGEQFDPAMPAFLPSGSITVTPIGTTLILIMEPGSGTKGEPGYWMTLYTIKNDKLLPSSRLFHSSARQPAMIDMSKWRFRSEPARAADGMPAKAAISSSSAPSKPAKTGKPR